LYVRGQIRQTKSDYIYRVVVFTLFTRADLTKSGRTSDDLDASQKNPRIPVDFGEAGEASELWRRQTADSRQTV
jgi:hypothetical protein